MDNLTPEQVRTGVLPSLIGNYRGWTLLMQCGHCVRSVQKLSVDLIAIQRPSLTVARVVERLRCRHTASGYANRCGNQPKWVAIQAPDNSVLYVLRSTPGAT